MATLSILERFMKFVSPEPNTGCWLWLGEISHNGYGRMAFYGSYITKRAAHCVAYELFNGAIPEGLEIDHKCRVRCCVNPQHLEAVTHSVNVRRGISGPINAARHKAKTHCPRGHEYTASNIYYTNKNARACKLCWAFQRERRKAKLQSMIGIR